MAPSSRSKLKPLYDLVKQDNEILDADTRRFVTCDNMDETDDASKLLNEDRKAALRQLLRRLYTNICNLYAYHGSPSTSDSGIMAAWASHLKPIASLAELRLYGSLIAARMLLYLTRAFVHCGHFPHDVPATEASFKPMAMRCHFLITLDDALLEQLKTLWTTSLGRETFGWVFSDYPVVTQHKCHNCQKCCLKELKDGPADASSSGIDTDWTAWTAQKTEERIRAACLTTPEDMTPANGVRCAYTWKRPEGDTAYYPQHEEATRWMFNDDNDNNTSGPRLLMGQKVGTDGPIREELTYNVVDEDTRESQWRSRPALRRSRQFILDTQKVRVGRQRRSLATWALTVKGRLPAELVCEIWKYIEPVPQEPYLEKLDLPSVYQPFPGVVNPGARGRTKCDECSKRSYKATDKLARRTCPLKSIVFWNLPLRVFHTLHETAVPNRWRLCRLLSCAGHHHDEDWILPFDGEDVKPLEDHLLSILRSQSRAPDITLETAGLGGHEPGELPTQKEDAARQRRLFRICDRSDPFQEDTVAEAHWSGLMGLVDVMCTGMVTVGKYPHGGAFTDPSWLLGRTRLEEMRARAAFRCR